jgi:hypothetical protein
MSLFLERSVDRHVNALKFTQWFTSIESALDTRRPGFAARGGRWRRSGNPIT